MDTTSPYMHAYIRAYIRAYMRAYSAVKNSFWNLSNVLKKNKCCKISNYFRVVPDAAVKLVNSDRQNTGIVQIEYAGTWGNICPNAWDDTDATVSLSLQSECVTFSTVTSSLKFTTRHIYISYYQILPSIWCQWVAKLMALHKKYHWIGTGMF